MIFPEKLYKQYDSSFLNQVASIPGGEKIKECIQCGTCSGSCPSGGFMDHGPRKLFAMIRAGMKDEVLSSNTIWYCVSCYNCYVRCPQSIKVTDVMYAIKSISTIENKFNKRFYSPKFTKTFVEIVSNNGRNSEFKLMMKYFMRTNILDAIKNIPVSIRLWRKGRLKLKSQKIKHLDDFKKISRKVNSLGGL
jgi:heterodisulfide reductase subunit C